MGWRLTIGECGFYGCDGLAIGLLRRPMSPCTCFYPGCGHPAFIYYHFQVACTRQKLNLFCRFQIGKVFAALMRILNSMGKTSFTHPTISLVPFASCLRLCQSQQNEFARPTWLSSAKINLNKKMKRDIKFIDGNILSFVGGHGGWRHNAVLGEML
ncbi:MAG: hypothetical protein JEZ07_04160 [Phycisphaerae bacterium]|nr:hypothetical protein [Phycisphaerae bacterium]